MTIVATIDPVFSGRVTAVTAALIALAGLLVLLWRRRLLLGTTLMAAWWWANLSLVAIAGSEMFIAVSGRGRTADWYESVRFATSATICCPFMAVLGAKRPQHRAWQFIVLALWGCLVLPAIENVLLQPGQPLEIHDARSWFLAILIGVAAVNSVPTRFWPSALLLTAAQIILFGPYLPLTPPFPYAGDRLAGLALSLIAMALAACGVPTRPFARTPEDRLWLDFRDWYGAFWAFRLAERINAAAYLHNWGIALSWRGFRPAKGRSVSEDLRLDSVSGLHSTLANLLRRFVSRQWIDLRLKDSNLPVGARGFESSATVR